MKLLNERNQINAVAKRWESQYLDYQCEEKQRIGQQLKDLNIKTATALDVANIIGNEAWVHPRICDECGKQTWDLVRIGEDPGSETAEVCSDCLIAALKLIEQERIR